MPKFDEEETVKDNPVVESPVEEVIQSVAEVKTTEEQPNVIIDGVDTRKV